MAEHTKSIYLSVFVTILSTLVQNRSSPVDTKHQLFRLDRLALLAENCAVAKATEIVNILNVPISYSIVTKLMEIARHFTGGPPNLTDPVVTVFITVENGQISEVICDLDSATEGEVVDEDEGGAMDVDEQGKEEAKED